VSEIAIQPAHVSNSESRSEQEQVTQQPPCNPLGMTAALLWSGVAVATFHLAYSTPCLAILTVVYVFALLQLTRARTDRQTFYLSLGVGMLIAAPQLSCFWTLFGLSSVALWLILALWTALFVTLSRLCLIRLGQFRAAILLPFLWTGLEYFRSELYYLRFSWLNIGYAFSASAYQPALNFLGVYGIGFLTVTVAAGVWLQGFKRVAIVVGIVTVSCALIWSVFWHGLQKRAPGKPAQVAGVQLEFPAEHEVIAALDKLIETKPDTQIIVLCEYAFLSPIPDKIKTWCKEHQRFLVAGGKDPLPSEDFYDTAFVVGTNGDIVFQQGKSVPVQFLKDGLPAKGQQLWDSPWGKIGICICYDLSYTRVTDRLVRMGAQAMIVPTMDVVEWGGHEHELHARVARVRAAEYGIPIFRVASSGISQLVDRQGVERASAGFPGQNETLSGTMFLSQAGSCPIDRWLGLIAAGISGLIILFLVARRVLPL
jgi:apolipoprotein N-acyltransferase